MGIIRTTALVFTLVIGVLFPDYSQADFKKIKIAVLDFQVQGQQSEQKDLGKIVAEWTITALVKDGRFEIIERRLLEKVLQEQQLIMEGVVDSDKAVQLGNLLGVEELITGSVLIFQDIMEVNARIINTKDAHIISAESVRGKTTTQLADLVVQMADKIITHFPLEGYVVHKEGDSLVIDLGRISGVKPDMQFVTFKEGRIIKHPKTGEILDIETKQTGLIEITAVSEKTARARILAGAETIAYGQRVKSLSRFAPASSFFAEPPPTPATPGEPPKTPVKAAAKATPEAPPSAPAAPQKYITMLQSPTAATKTLAARQIITNRLFDDEILKVVKEELQRGYLKDQRDKNQVEAMSWLCKVLGNSGRSEYKQLLQTISTSSAHHKLRRYAKQSYQMLQ